MRLWTLGTSIFLRLWGTYVFPRSPSWLDFIQHLGVCCFVAFLSVSLFSAAFYWILPPVALLSSVWMITCVFLCCSKRARCFILLAVLSCGLREGRNALIAAGTGVVIFGHVENIFYNFRGLLDSMTCNLRAKSFSVHFPLLKRYTEAIQWIYGLATPLNLFDDLVSWNQTLVVSLFSPSHALEAHMNDTRGEVLGVLHHMVVTTELLTSVGQKLLALAGLLLILVSTGLFLKRFLGPCGWKYENVYITKQFVRFDEKERHQQRPCVLPLNKKERKKYVIVPSLQLTPKEKKTLGLFFLPVLTYLYMWVLFAAVDYLLYRLISSMNKQFQSLPGLEVHLKLRGELKILVSVSFYPKVERERIEYLHAKLLEKRSKQPLREADGKPSLYFKKIHFWFPVLKMIRKKQTIPANEDDL
ncbi:dendritic cell-specific transmembrane protein isoform 3 [Mus musculus]|uniref:Isoform 3 of Dendritic cell-specific transmembrane protein n=1 Tax=Mus musculus TaxID=10090 RepID=Q7TNJ0-3|nr:dendritic cell-specific transmembrane protein isoform 3 [Mus musculus]BAC81439.1 differentially spliced dendritic cell-specific transmembrane protein [Mus musculus]|eukprot:NP_001276437.1 dendritic cell-specific transmembrane protein isoform 3 [Mus musculus]